MTTTLHLTRAHNWRTSAACQGVDLEMFFVDNPGTQARIQGICRGCPVRTSCLADTLDYEGQSHMRWGVVGGLTTCQRRALRCEALLGNRPNLKQARVLSSPVWAAVMVPLRHRGLSPAQIAVELRAHDVLVSAVTVRVAVWWAGGKGSVMPRRGPGDGRQVWELVRDECREVVYGLRELGAGNRDVAAYLQVSEDALARAIHAWRAEASEGVKAA
ncbi:WhiB family transcriptional regulator [Streptomyces sp. NBRC 110035]|uniref:WhiB family transcriptional regulator n=1 Tax=Streptomyces sp. NBRC 110035 TaxID=1547867 RepID=UPI0006985259|nr:WhiB family transcriptional regulator [Streptomyces sp. NBRC 110035]